MEKYKLLKRLKKERNKIDAFIGQWDSNEESSWSQFGSNVDDSNDEGSFKKKNMIGVAIKEAP